MIKQAGFVSGSRAARRVEGAARDKQAFGNFYCEQEPGRQQRRIVTVFFACAQSFRAAMLAGDEISRVDRFAAVRRPRSSSK